MRVILFPASFASSRTRFLIPHFLPFPLVAFPSAGDVGKIVLPEGMQTVSFERCDGLTGTADSRMSEVHIYLIRFEASRTRFLISSFYHFASFCFPTRRCR